jgi:hypothetical protein
MAVLARENGTCPHCGVKNKFEGVDLFVPGLGSLSNADTVQIESDIGDKKRYITIARCGNDECRKVIIYFGPRMVVPLGTARPAAPQQVPPDVADDYADACNVEPVSKKAAAALARRCLQNMLHERGIKGKNLETEIEIAMETLPSNLADDIDAIRHVGNYAAHPTKSTNTGVIVDVEPEETEYLLETLVDLFDHYYVKPAKSAAKRAALQAKLDAAGKNVEVKKSSPAQG